MRSWEEKGANLSSGQVPQSVEHLSSLVPPASQQPQERQDQGSQAYSGAPQQLGTAVAVTQPPTAPLCGGHPAVSWAPGQFSHREVPWARCPRKVPFPAGPQFTSVKWVCNTGTYPTQVSQGGDNLADSRKDRSEFPAFGFQNPRPWGQTERTLGTEMSHAQLIFQMIFFHKPI